LLSVVEFYGPVEMKLLPTKEDIWKSIHVVLANLKPLKVDLEKRNLIVDRTTYAQLDCAITCATDVPNTQNLPI